MPEASIIPESMQEEFDRVRATSRVGLGMFPPEVAAQFGPGSFSRLTPEQIRLQKRFKELHYNLSETAAAFLVLAEEIAKFGIQLEKFLEQGARSKEL